MDIKHIMETINDNPNAGIRVLDPSTLEGGFVNSISTRETPRIYMTIDEISDVEIKKYADLTETWDREGDNEYPTHLVVFIDGEAHMIVDAISIAGYVTLIAEY